jgi:hypothetical protein
MRGQPVATVVCDGLRYGWPVLALLGLLWFPFDWLSEVWPAFGVPFRRVFRDAQDHFVGHTLFFLIVGALVLAYLPALRRRPHWYFPCLILAALVQETIQALFRGEAPTFTDLNAFKGDALGGTSAFALWLAILLVQRVYTSHRSAGVRPGARLPACAATGECAILRGGDVRGSEVRMANPAETVTARARPALWLRLTIPAGNTVQLAGLALGGLLLAIAARWHTGTAVRVALMLVGFFAIYDCCHALAHWAVGRLVGIRFRGYGVRGTDHPEDYPPGIRQVMSVVPFFTVMTAKESMRRAQPWAKAAMFAAGETSTTICSLLAGLYAWRAGIPGGQVLFIVMVVFSVFSTIVTAILPRGDYTKARRALRRPRGTT